MTQKSWRCDVCGQVVTGFGPWCDVYCTERRMLCLGLVEQMVTDYIVRGEAELAGLVLEYRDRRWPPISEQKPPTRT